ncbi:MAG: relaxase/mobilization nuclease domain-containing protein [Prevotella sp.]|jgi:hypothetical protein|nr:relaxase/mobilization nuclease domain-containing protein [Prevotella sp.]
MLAKILDKTGSFNAVNYNSKKLNKGSGELMAIQNIPTLSLNKIPSQEVVKDYLKAYSNTNKRVKQPQFHAMISAKGKEYDKYQITEVAKLYMDKMGYGKQPYVIIYHNDTDNNHVHIVSTRVTKDGKKIYDGLENVRSQKVMQEIMKEKYNISESRNLEKLLSYKYADFSQLKTLVERNSFRIREKEGKYNFYKGGVLITTVNQLSPAILESKEKALLKAKLISYSNSYDATLKYQRDKGIWSSQAVTKLKESLGIDIVFHHKGDKEPFGYTVIDNANKTVIKGSDILKLSQFINPVPTPTEDRTIQPEIEPTVVIVPEDRTGSNQEDITSAQDHPIDTSLDIPIVEIEDIDESDYYNEVEMDDERKQPIADVSSAVSDFLNSINEDEEEQEQEDQENNNKLKRKRKR